MRFFSILLLSVFILSSCNSEVQVVKEIRKLENRVDSLNDVYNKIPFNNIDKIYKEMVQNSEIIKSYPEDLSKIDENYISYYGNYSASMKIISRLVNKESRPVQSELNKAKIQLSNLKYDVKKNLISQDSVLFFLETERNAVNELFFKVKSIEDGITMQKKVFEKTNSQVLELVNKINNVN